MRDLAASAGLLTALGSQTPTASAENSAVSAVGERTTVRDKMWMWGHLPGSLDHEFNIPGSSRMTPAEAATYFNVPNIIMCEIYNKTVDPVTGKVTKIGCDLLPHPPYDPWLVSFRPFKRVVWSIVTGGQKIPDKEDLETFHQLSDKYPNIVGATMDDFMQTTWDGGWRGVLSPSELDYLQHRLKGAGRKLNLWMTTYMDWYPIEEFLTPYFGRIDIVHCWAWKAEHLEQYEDSLRKIEKVGPRTKKMMGVFMWDFGNAKAMPLNLLEKHCQNGLKWIHQGRIEGMILFGSPICDLNLEAVEWTRKWVQSVGDEKL